MRSRTVKPSFFTNEDLAELSAMARLLFIGLFMFADREGRFEWRPKRMKAEIFPYENVKMDGLLSELTGGGFIVRYSVDGQEYGEIPNFVKHQPIHPHEAKSTIPSCHDRDVITCNDITRQIPTSSTELVCIGNSNNNSKGTGKGTITSTPKTPHGENGNVLLADDEFPKLQASYGDQLPRAIDVLDAWIESKPGKLQWFSKKYSSAFSVLNPKTSWVRNHLAWNGKSAPKDAMDRRAAREADAVEIAKRQYEAEQAYVQKKPAQLKIGG